MIEAAGAVSVRSAGGDTTVWLDGTLVATLVGVTAVDMDAILVG